MSVETKPREAYPGKLNDIFRSIVGLNEERLSEIKGASLAGLNLVLDSFTHQVPQWIFYDCHGEAKILVRTAAEDPQIESFPSGFIRIEVIHQDWPGEDRGFIIEYEKDEFGGPMNLHEVTFYPRVGENSFGSRYDATPCDDPRFSENIGSLDFINGWRSATRLIIPRELHHDLLLPASHSRVSPSLILSADEENLRLTGSVDGRLLHSPFDIVIPRSLQVTDKSLSWLKK